MIGRWIGFWLYMLIATGLIVYGFISMYYPSVPFSRLAYGETMAGFCLLLFSFVPLVCALPEEK